MNFNVTTINKGIYVNIHNFVWYLFLTLALSSYLYTKQQLRQKGSEGWGERECDCTETTKKEGGEDIRVSRAKLCCTTGKGKTTRLSKQMTDKQTGAKTHAAGSLSFPLRCWHPICTSTPQSTRRLLGSMFTCSYEGKLQNKSPPQFTQIFATMSD